MRKFIFGLNAANYTYYIEKCFKLKLFRIKFPTKTQWMHISIFSRSEAGAPQRLRFLKYYNLLALESRFTSGVNAADNTNYIKKCIKQKLFGIKFSKKKK